MARHLESQRREANRPIGFRPRGVSVSLGEIGADGMRRDVITLRFVRSLAGASFAFFMAGLTAVCGFGLLKTLVVMWIPEAYDVTTTINTAWPLLIPATLALFFGCPFFGFHFTHLGWLALLMIPCILFLIATADYSRMAEPDEDW